MIWWALAACQPGGSDGSPDPSPRDLFSDAIATVVVEVDYAPGAPPRTGDQGRLWDLFEVNAQHLLGPDKDLQIPHDLSEMEEMVDPGEESYDRDAILALSEANRDERSEGDLAAFHALWLDGYYEDSSGVRDDVIGVSLTGTSVVAMFAPVVEGVGLTEVGRGYGEQATFIHEFGHAVGLVNNGVPLTSEHHDAEHGAHCNVDSCVMYWAYEGPSELATFVAQYVTTNDAVLFGDECTADVEALRE